MTGVLLNGASSPTDTAHALRYDHRARWAAVGLATLRPKLQQLTGRPGYTHLLLRIGTPTQVKPAAPRRPLADVLATAA